VKIPVVDNGGQWTHREWRVLRDLDVESEIVPNTRDLSGAAVDGIVLSGGALSVESSDAPLGAIDRWIDSVEVPVLGICVGHQYLARHFGGTVSRNTAPAFGRVRLTVDEPAHPLFEGLPVDQLVWESHNDSVAQVPPGWRRLAHSEGCPVEAMSHPTRPIFGVQFHPEVEHTEQGREIFRRFLATCRR
jgi:GMP synthase (glutamine-hydrolysing)